MYQRIQPVTIGSTSVIPFVGGRGEQCDLIIFILIPVLARCASEAYVPKCFFPNRPVTLVTPLTLCYVQCFPHLPTQTET